MKWAKVPISPQFLFDRICLPADTKLLQAYVNDAGNLEIVVEHPDLPDRDVKDDVPVAYPEIRKTTTRRDEFVNWGLDRA